MKKKIVQNGIEVTQGPKNYNQFLNTVRVYAQRLRQEKDLSLKYLNQINHMSQSLRLKDIQVQKLKKLNRQLTQKLSVYNSVLTRSRTISPMRMSTVIGKNNLTQSILQTKHQQIQNLKPFQQFFILDLSQIDKKLIKYRYSFLKQNQIFQQVITRFIDNCQGPDWNVQAFGISQNNKTSKSILSIYNSPFTTKKQSQVSSQILSKINPSFYYFLHCFVQKQLISLQGKYYWAPVVYGFISFLPFSNSFFSLLQHITSDIKLKSQSDIKTLDQSLQLLNAIEIKIPQQLRFKFFNKIQIWKIPQNTQEFILSYSIDVLKNFALQLIIDILMLFLIQIPITLVSSNQQILSKFMFYFIFIIKPLKYPFPIIFNLTQKMKTLLQSPFPTFLGTTNSTIIQSYLCQRAVFDLDKKVAKSWPMIDNLDSSRKFLLSIAHRIGSFQKLSQVTIQIIKGHQYQQLQPYWKDFTRTQIYNNYVYNQ